MDLKTFIDWANENQGLLAIIIFIISLVIGLIGWIFNKSKNNPVIKKKFIQKGGKKSKNIQAENINLNIKNDN